jgi:hypothetical protein
MLNDARWRLIGAAALTVAFMTPAAVHAAGTDDNQAPKSAEKAEDPDDLLAGPKVEDDASPASGDMMRPAGEPQRRGQRQAELPFRRWMEIIRQQELSPEQQDQIREIAGELQSQTQQFQQNPENRELMRQIREARQNGTEPPVQAREKMQQFEANRPKPEAFQQRIWAVLTTQQQDAAKAQMDAARQQIVEQQRARRDARQDGGNPDEPAMEPGQPPRGDAAARGTGNARDASRAPDRARRRGAGGGGEGLDDMAKRRANFLKSRQAGAKRGGSAATGNQAPRNRGGGKTADTASPGKDS